VRSTPARALFLNLSTYSSSCYFLLRRMGWAIQSSSLCVAEDCWSSLFGSSDHAAWRAGGLRQRTECASWSSVRSTGPQRGPYKQAQWSFFLPYIGATFFLCSFWWLDLEYSKPRPTPVTGLSSSIVETAQKQGHIGLHDSIVLAECNVRSTKWYRLPKTSRNRRTSQQWPWVWGRSYQPWLTLRWLPGTWYSS